jgi:thiamine kinase-like enzyme
MAFEKHMSVLANLPCWQGQIMAEPLTGGITNVNYKVRDGDLSYVVRLGEDIPVHGVMRFNELAASKAAAAIGLSPAVHHHEQGVLVIEFVEGKTLGEEDVQQQAMLERVLPVIKTCHRDVPNQLRGPILTFWVFHILRDYAQTVNEGNSAHKAMIPSLMAVSDKLENAVGSIDLVFSHNDLLPANFIDAGDKIWLIDWDYAGFNSPLFDLGGLASNNGLSEGQEKWLLENYFELPLTEQLWHSYIAMKAASLQRETMWSMVSELHSEIEFDFTAYTAENLDRLQGALAELGLSL